VSVFGLIVIVLLAFVTTVPGAVLVAGGAAQAASVSQAPRPRIKGKVLNQGFITSRS